MRKLFLASCIFLPKEGSIDETTGLSLIAIDTVAGESLYQEEDRAGNLALKHWRRREGDGRIKIVEIHHTIDERFEQLAGSVGGNGVYEKLPGGAQSVPETIAGERRSKEVLCDTGAGEWCVGFYDHTDQKWASHDSTVVFDERLIWYDLIPGK